MQEFYGFYQGRNAIQGAKLAEPYIGLWIHVAGEITILNPDGAGAVVWLKQDAASTECRFGEQWVRDLSRRKLGDHLKVIGKIKPYQPNGTLYLSDCELEKEMGSQPITETSEQAAQPIIQGQGGKGGSGEIFGNNGTIIGGKGGNVGPGGVGRGGDGGGGFIHGDGGIIIGGEGGSVDGTNIWFPPAQSGYIQYLESHGQTPDFGIQYPGAGGASAGWLQRQLIVAKIREEYFKKTGQEAKIRSSKIEDVPLAYINEKLKEAGYLWRARIEKKYWYLYYVPSDH